MTDLVKRLRVGIHQSTDEQALRNEAADRIEALEAALREITTFIDPYGSAGRIARAALGEKKDD